MESIFLPILFTALFFLALVGAGSNAYWHRSWYLWSLIFSGLLTSLAYGARIVWAANHDGDAFNASLRLKSLGSFFLAVAIYMTFGRLVWWITPNEKLNPRTLWFPPVRAMPWMYGFLIVFVVLQCITYTSFLHVVGLILQSTLFVYFLVLTLRYRMISVHWGPQGVEILPARWKKLLDAVVGLAALTTLRSLLGFLTYFGSFYAGVQMYVIDAVPMLICFAIFQIVHPGSYLPEDYTALFLDKQQTTQNKAADVRVAELIRGAVAGVPGLGGNANRAEPHQRV